MSIAPVEINLELINQKVKFIVLSKTNQETPITIDFSPPLGDGEGFLALDLLVMSFAGCVSTGIVALLRRMGKNISAYRMNVTGIKRESPLSLEKIFFEIIINSTDISEQELQNVVKKAEEISPVWIAIKNNVEVAWQYKIIAL
ncbi:MAG: OsmC family protein [Syntrophomonadaceae bacterium]|nr:OsmC family protein [Syntrophomonadaceae bacterium]